MVTEKNKPSIYSERSAIGSADELDEYGVWVKSDPQDLSASGFDGVETELDDFPLPDIDADFGGGADFGKADGIADEGGEELPDFDLSEDSAGEPAAASQPAAESLPADDLDGFFVTEDGLSETPAEEFFSEVSIDSFLDETPPAEPDAAEELAVTAFPDEGETAFTGRASANVQAGSGNQDLSTQLLMKIAEELSSIKEELSTLKEELSSIRGGPRVEEKHDEQHSGFFNEEEDEKIALTGDELNNILNTADFTEEAGVDAGAEILPGAEESPPQEAAPDAAAPDAAALGDAAVDAAPPEPSASDETPEETEEEEIEIDLDDLGIDLNSIDPSASEESAEDGAAEPALDLSPAAELSLDGESSGSAEDAPAAVSLSGEADELLQLMDEGIEPMTVISEDVSFLENEPDELPAVESIETSGEDFPDGALLETGGESTELIALDDISALEEISMTHLAEDLPPLEEPAGKTDDEPAFDSAALDLSDAVIDEPDLSTGITETPLEEPSLDALSLDEIAGVSLDDLDAIENADASGEAELPLPEESAELEALPSENEENLDQIIPEGFVVENAEPPVEDETDASFDEDELAIPELSSVEDLQEPAFTAADGETPPQDSGDAGVSNIPAGLKNELKTVLSYMDRLLESLPEEKIEEFAQSEYFDTYKKLFKELGLV